MVDRIYINIFYSATLQDGHRNSLLFSKLDVGRIVHMYRLHAATDPVSDQSLCSRTLHMARGSQCPCLALQVGPSTCNSVHIRHGVKYIEMYLNTNTNTFEGFKYKYKYFKMQMYLNTNTFEKYFKYFFKYFSFSGYITI